MTRKQLLEALNAKYEVIVNTPYHLQIVTGIGKHNIWFNRNDGIRFQAFGERDSDWISARDLLRKLETYDYEQTGLAEMKSLTNFLGKISGRTGIFVDAGWKDGKYKLAVVRLYETGGMDIKVQVGMCSDSLTAECHAYNLADELHPGDEPIYTDCKAVVDMGKVRAVWISRKFNGQADALGNMRGE